MLVGEKSAGETKVSSTMGDSQYKISKIGKSRNSSKSIVFKSMATFTNEK